MLNDPPRITLQYVTLHDGDKSFTIAQVCCNRGLGGVGFLAQATEMTETTETNMSPSPRSNMLLMKTKPPI